jgi:hypothetical protein
MTHIPDLKSGAEPDQNLDKLILLKRAGEMNRV